MGKNFCKIENKWCKYCSKNGCKFNHCQGQYTPLNIIRKCPIRLNKETISFRNLLLQVSFEDVMNAMAKYWPDQEKHRRGYKNVYIKLLGIRGIRTDYFIKVKYIQHYDIEYDYNKHDYVRKYKDIFWPCADAVKYNKQDYNYSIDSFRWGQVATMNILKSTLDNVNPADIIAGVLYELTFNGYTEEAVDEFYESLHKTYEEMRNNK